MIKLRPEFRTVGESGAEGMSAVFPRIREIIDAFGGRLWVSLEAHPAGALVVLERPDQAGTPRAMLDGYGTEVLWGYIMSARLALPHGLPEERVDGSFPFTLYLAHEPKVSLVMAQQDGTRMLEIPAPFWDRLFAELCIVIAHARELGRRADRWLQ